MKKAYIIPAALLIWGLAAPTLADDTVTSKVKSETTIKKDTDGEYHKKQTKSVESTDETGTTTKSQTKVEVNTEADGTGESKVTTETSTDPKGILNKTKTVTTDSVKYEDGKIEKSYKKKVDGKTVEENKEETTTNH